MHECSWFSVAVVTWLLTGSACDLLYLHVSTRIKSINRANKCEMRVPFGIQHQDTRFSLDLKHVFDVLDKKKIEKKTLEWKIGIKRHIQTHVAYKMEQCARIKSTKASFGVHLFMLRFYSFIFFSCSVCFLACEQTCALVKLINVPFWLRNTQENIHNEWFFLLLASKIENRGHKTNKRVNSIRWSNINAPL